MIRHIVAFNFADNVNDAERTAILGELDELPTRFPAMQQWTRGTNVSERDRTYAHAFSVDFQTEDALINYLDSDDHERFVALRFRPNVRDRAIVSYEYQSRPE